MRALRLHNKETSNTVDYTLGLSHFLPGGGTEYVETGVELIYFILEGEMTVRTKAQPALRPVVCRPAKRRCRTKRTWGL